MRRLTLEILAFAIALSFTVSAEAEQATSLDRCISAISGDVLRFVDKAGKCVRQCEDAKRNGKLAADTRCRRPSSHAATQSCLLRAGEQLTGSKSMALKRCVDDEIALFYGATKTCPGNNENLAALLKCLGKRGEKAVETVARKIYHPEKDSVCGDGTISDGEQCDPNAFPSGCSYPASVCQPFGCYCVPEGCGNGVLDAGEDCDYFAFPNGCSFTQSCNGSCECTSTTEAAFLTESSDLIE